MLLADRHPDLHRHLPIRPGTKPITRPVVPCHSTLSRLDTLLPAVVTLGSSG
jgi:hypothetical protein